MEICNETTKFTVPSSEALLTAESSSCPVCVRLSADCSALTATPEHQGDFGERKCVDKGKRGWGATGRLSPPQTTLTCICRLHPTLSVHCLRLPFLLVVIFWALIPFQEKAKRLTSSISVKLLKNAAKVSIRCLGKTRRSRAWSSAPPPASLSLLKSCRVARGAGRDLTIPRLQEQTQR